MHVLGEVIKVSVRESALILLRGRSERVGIGRDSDRGDYGGSWQFEYRII